MKNREPLYGKPIQMKNIGDTPATFLPIFDDVDEYKALLD